MALLSRGAALGRAALGQDEASGGAGGLELVVVDAGFGGTFVGQVQARGAITAGVGAASADGGSAANYGHAALATQVTAMMAAIKVAAAALAEGVAAQEHWAARAIAAAELAASGEFGSAFYAASTGAEIGAVDAGTVAGAAFTTTLAAVAALAPGATVHTTINAIAQLGGSVNADSHIGASAAALVVVQAALSQGAALGEAWATSAGSLVDLAAEGVFGAQFDALAAGVEAGLVVGATAAAASFFAGTQSLAAITGAAGLGESLRATAASAETWAAEATLRGSFAAVGGTDEVLPPARQTLHVPRRLRTLHVQPRTRVLRVIPRI